jgi:hypothetical protein
MRDCDDSSFGMMVDENIVWPPFVDGLTILKLRTKREDDMADDREKNQGMKQGGQEGGGQHAPGRNPQDDRSAGGQDREGRGGDFDPSRGGDGANIRKPGSTKNQGAKSALSTAGLSLPLTAYCSLLTAY